MRNITNPKESRQLKSSAFRKYLLEDTGSVRDIWLLEVRISCLCNRANRCRPEYRINHVLSGAR
ncbi:hypothetical protein TNCT_335241, partial [Trichonephila clavata]